VQFRLGWDRRGRRAPSMLINPHGGGGGKGRAWSRQKSRMSEREMGFKNRRSLRSPHRRKGEKVPPGAGHGSKANPLFRDLRGENGASVQVDGEDIVGGTLR